MSFRCIPGLALSLIAFGVYGQDGAAEVTPVPDPAAAVVTELTEAHGEAAPGDAERGSQKAAACAACHGVDGNAVDPQYPKLAAQHEAYTARQLALFKSGERNNAIMLGFSAALSPQDMRDIGAWFASQASLPGVADESPIEGGPYDGMAFYEVGEQLYRGGDAERAIPACVACHGPAGDGNPGPAYPRLAGQHAQYTADMLTRYRNGEIYPTGEHGAVMAGVAKYLSDIEIQALASYIEGLHAAETGALPGSGTAAAR